MCEYVLKLCHPLLIIGLLLLQSCHHNVEEKKEAVVKEAKLAEAAKYNSQLGLGYLSQGDRSRAKRKLVLALKQAPNEPGVNESMAYFMEKSGDLEQAEIYYQKAMALAPGVGTQLNNYGTFLCRQGKYREAEGYFVKAIKDIGYDHTAGAYENAGLCVLAIPDNKNAAKYFSKALEYDPSREQSLYELVNLEMKQGNTDEALMYLQKYSNLTLHNRTLLGLAVDVSRKADKIELEADYKLRLYSFADNTGGNNEYDSNNG